MMYKPYLIIVNGSLMGRKLTKQGAIKTCESFWKQGINATVAYEITPGNYEQIAYPSNIWAYLNK